MTGVSLGGLITWLWQGSALALLTALMVRGARVMFGDVTASTRYLIWWAVLVAIVVLPLVGRVSLRSTASPASGVSPLSSLSRSPSTSGTADGALGKTKVQAAGTRATPGMASATGPVLTLPPVPGRLVAVGLGGWLAFVALRLRRVAHALDHLARVRQRCQPLAPARQRRLGRWTAQQARGRRTRLAVSDEIAVPALFGLTRPMVIIPRPLLDVLTDDELDHVVLHEQAHAQRWDDWALLLQSCVSAVFGLHPAVWTTTRALGRERELACDDRVIAQGGSPRLYALSVTRVAEVALGARPPTLAPGMSATRGSLTQRVERLLGQTTTSAGGRPAILILAGAAAALVTVMALLGQLRPLASTEQPGFPQVAHRLAPEMALTTVLPGLIVTRPIPAASQPLVGATPPARRAVGSPEITISEPGRPEPVPTVQTATIRPRPETVPRTAHLRPLPSNPLTPRTEVVVPVRLTATTAGAGWAPPRPLASRPVAPSSMPPVVNIQGLPPEPGLWRQLAHAGKALGSRTSDAGQATGDVFKRFGLTIGRAFTGEP